MSSISTQFSEGIVPEPGIFRNNTSYYSGFRWVDGDKVRFSSNVPEKIGGWQKELYLGSIAGVPRSILSWASLDSTRYKSIGTNLFLYVMNGGVCYNITPFSSTATLTDPITTVDTSTTVQITSAASGVREGDYVNFPSSVTYNGVTLLGDYPVIGIIDIDNYTITADTAANASGTGGGSVTIRYYLEAGLADSGAAGYGWGVGPYGEEEYGTARTVGQFQDARIWKMANWGEDLLALPIGGKLYFWDTSVGPTTEAQEVVNAPNRNNYMLVGSTFRQCILFGTEDVSGVFDPMLIRWSDTEDYTTWENLPTNAAGEYRLTQGSKIVGAVESKGGEIIVVTDTSAYRMTPTYTNDIYDIKLLGESCGLIAPMAIADIDGIVYWMSQSSFKMYTGQVRTLASSLEDYIFDQREPGFYNQEQKAKFFIGKNGDFNELWFFYATSGSTEIDRYAIYNYGNNSWYDGSLERTCWVDKSFGTKPYAMTRAADLYIHEQGKNDDASAMSSYIRLGEIDISSGSKIGFVDRYMPDGSVSGQMTLSVFGKRFPQSTTESRKDYPYQLTTEQISVRMRARLLSIQLSSNQINGDYKLGKIKAAIKPDGGR